MTTDGNTDAINRHLAEREAYDEQRDKEAELHDLRDEVEELNARYHLRVGDTINLRAKLEAFEVELRDALAALETETYIERLEQTIKNMTAHIRIDPDE